MIRRSVSIIGSFRKYYPQVLEAVILFEATGFLVKSPPVSRVINPGGNFVRFEGDSHELSDLEIQGVTMAKILDSDLVYVVAPGGYVGRTTCYELGRVQEKGISTYFSEGPKDLPISVEGEMICSVQQLVTQLSDVSNFTEV